MSENGNKIRIFDTTLRDGEQSPGVSITPEQKVQIAVKLDQLGVDAIEAGFPIVSQGEIQAIKSIKKAGLNAEICGLARALIHDIDTVIACDLNYVHTFIATSDIHMQYKLKMSPEQVIQKAVQAVDYAKSHGLQVEFSAEDATRSDIAFLTKVFRAVGEAGADRIDIPDTVGYATPEFISYLVRTLRENISVPISLHCHNDFGLAVANSIAGINAGATCAHVTVNGLGERAGNASLEEFVMALQCLYKKEHNIHTKLLFETSKSVSNIMGMAVQANKPIDPEMVGRKRWLQAGKHAGSHGIRAMLGDFGIECTDIQLRKIVERQKILADKGKSISTSELLSIAGEVVQNSKFEEKFKLYDFHIVTGMNLIPTAVIRLNTNGKDLIASDTGV